MRATAEERFSAPGTAEERITAYLRRERDVLRGCPVGRLTQDPDVLADASPRAPVEDTHGWLRGRLAEVLAEGRERGEPDPGLDVRATAAAIVAVLRGDYVIARAEGSPEPYELAVTGALDLLAARARWGRRRPAVGWSGAPVPGRARTRVPRWSVQPIRPTPAPPVR